MVRAHSLMKSTWESFPKLRHISVSDLLAVAHDVSISPMSSTPTTCGATRRHGTGTWRRPRKSTWCTSRRPELPRRELVAAGSGSPQHQLVHRRRPEHHHVRRPGSVTGCRHGAQPARSDRRIRVPGTRLTPSRRAKLLQRPWERAGNDKSRYEPCEQSGDERRGGRRRDDRRGRCCHPSLPRSRHPLSTWRR